MVSHSVYSVRDILIGQTVFRYGLNRARDTLKQCSKSSQPGVTKGAARGQPGVTRGSGRGQPGVTLGFTRGSGRGPPGVNQGSLVYVHTTHIYNNTNNRITKVLSRVKCVLTPQFNCFLLFKKSNNKD